MRRLVGPPGTPTVHSKASSRLRALLRFSASAGVALALGLAGGGAWAYFTSQGSGSGLTSTDSPTPIAVTAAASPAADENLYPGGPAVAVHFTVNNPNAYAVTFTGWSTATLSAVSPVGSNTCTTSDFQIAADSGTFSPIVSIPANTPASPGVSGAANGVVQLKPSAQNGCQGALVTVTLTLTGGKSS